MNPPLIPEAPPDVAAVRAFSRFYTQRMGVLHRRVLGSEYSLTEARVLLEVAARTTVRASDIATALELDPAYLSRILKRFAREGLVSANPDPDDRRGRLLGITAAGREVYADLNARSNADVEAKLAHLTPDQRAELVIHLAEARRLIEGASGPPPEISLRAPGAGDLGRIIHRHARLYFEEYGWDATFEHYVVGIVADLLRSDHAAANRGWVAEMDGCAVGSVYLQHVGPNLASLRLLYVERIARGFGVGARLVDTCIGAARAAGYRRLELLTVDCLTAARRIYESRGFRLERREEEHLFGKDLVTLTYALDL